MKYVCDVCGWEYDEEEGLSRRWYCTRNKVGGCSGRF